MKKISVTIFLFLFVASFPAHADSPRSFTAAKKMARKLFAEHRQTLYCQCQYNRKNQINLASCGMSVAKKKKRARRVEWEHMMPAENFGRQFTCWREKLCVKKNGKRYRGRKCCEKINPKFRHMEAELYNLWPSVGAVNQARSNYRYKMLSNKSQNYLGCPIDISKQARAVEPDDAAKGIVARANLFMAQHYQVRLSDSQRKLFTAWNRLYPPTTWEIDWAKAVKKVEGYGNAYILDYAKMRG